MDFIKQYPSMTFDDFFWKYSRPMVQIMCSDATYIKYLTEKQAKEYQRIKPADQYDNLDKFTNDLGIPML